MKFKLLFFALLAIFMTNCTREPISEPIKEEGEIITISATIPAETRVSYTDSDIPGNGGTLAWQSNDQLLLAGYAANGRYLGNKIFTWKAGNTFEGSPIQGATTYKAYYPGDEVVLDANGNVKPFANNFWLQSQSGNNSTTHLRYKLLLFDEEANPTTQSFVLALKNDIIKINLNNRPDTIGAIKKVIWTVETTTEGETQSAMVTILNYTHTPGANLTAYIAFDPAVTKIAAGGKVKITLIGNQSYEWWSDPIANLTTYAAGKRYKANVSGPWTPAETKFSFNITTNNANQLYEIWQQSVPSTNPAKLTIEWGDGSSETIAKGASLPNTTIASHTYVNAGNHTITIYSDEADPIAKQLPQLTFNNYPYGDTLLTAVLTPFLNMKATAFTGCFRSCTGLTSIPAELFKYNTDATSFYQCFEQCTGLTSIPTALFRNNTKATTFTGCFRSCTGLTSIPAELFKYNTLTEDFFSCFLDCKGLTSIPAELFKYNNYVRFFGYCFSGCTQLTSIPANLFSYNYDVATFINCFAGDT
jgi:hypothetical protein